MKKVWILFILGLLSLNVSLYAQTEETNPTEEVYFYGLNIPLYEGWKWIIINADHIKSGTLYFNDNQVRVDADEIYRNKTEDPNVKNTYIDAIKELMIKKMQSTEVQSMEFKMDGRRAFLLYEKHEEGTFFVLAYVEDLASWQYYQFQGVVKRENIEELKNVLEKSHW